MSTEYATVVFPNGRIIAFRQRTIGENRFKASLVSPTSDCTMGRELLAEFDELYDIDYDDCNGDELATFLRFVMQSA